MDEEIKVSASDWHLVKRLGIQRVKLEPLATILSPNKPQISVTIRFMSAQLEGCHSPKEDISKELAVNSCLPSGQEAASSKYKIGHVRISQLSPAS